ncbi:MAG TPA: YkgJ family cysteine cluster protein [Chitinivibrionales bacterium]
MEQFQIELDFPEGVVGLSYKKNDGPCLVWHLAADMIPLADTLTEMGTALAATFGKTVSCKKGCGVCCCQMVPLSPPEAAIIADVVDRMPPLRKNEVLAAFSRGLEKLDAADLTDAISGIYSTRTEKEKVLEINRAYFDLGIVCPFLENGACGIYHDRPSRCREYSVLSPASCCADPFDNSIRKLPITLKLCESLSQAWSTLTGKPPVIVPLIKALDWVQNNPGIRELSIYGSEHFIKSVLEFACAKANTVARDRAASGGKPAIGRC